MKQWDIWMEGFRVNLSAGEYDTARYVGRFPGDTFREACDAYAATKDDEWRSVYDSIGPSWWGCRFFDNEADARKSFG